MTIKEFRDRLRALIVEAINAGIGARQIMEELRHCASLASLTIQRSDDNDEDELTLPLSRLSIERYKGLEGLEFEDFGKINLIVGANNCGKTNVLNYVYIRLFEDCSESFSGRAFRVPSSSVQEFDFGRLQIDSSEASSVLELLKIADPAITDFTKRLYVHRKGSGTLLVHQLGAGINRLLQIAIGIARAENGVLLIDDIELGLGCDRLNEIFDWIVRWAEKHNTQIFAATHSHHLVDALVRATKSDSDLVLHRLESVESGTLVIRHGRDRLERLREMDQNVLGWVRSL